MDQFSERTIGLAGIFQAAKLVQQAAREGDVERIARRASLNSVLILDAMNTMAVYADLDGIRLGLTEVRQCFSNERDESNLETFKYVVHLAQLQRRLLADEQAMANFTRQVESLSRYQEDELADAMAQIYVEFISNLQPRIIVNGEQGYLADPGIAAQVRGFLLCGIRAAFLWHQKGGTRMDFIFRRKRYSEAARQILMGH